MKTLLLLLPFLLIINCGSKDDDAPNMKTDTFEITRNEVLINFGYVGRHAIGVSVFNFFNTQKKISVHIEIKDSNNVTTNQTANYIVNGNSSYQCLFYYTPPTSSPEVTSITVVKSEILSIGNP